MDRFSYRTLALIMVFLAIPIVFLWQINHKGGIVQAGWYNDSWGYRQTITVPSHATSESNVFITVPEFDATNSSKFQADCGDLRFTKQNGQLLPFFVVDCDATATIHVQFDTLPAGPSVYYMYYGNPNAPNGFVDTDFATAATGLGTLTIATEETSPGPIVYWKFNEGVGSTAYDTIQGNNGTLSGASWQPDDKCISGKCLYFNGNANTKVTSNNNVLTTDDFTVQTWFKTGLNQTKVLIGNRGGGVVSSGFTIYLSGGNIVATYGNGTSSATNINTAFNYSDNKWHYLVYKVERTSQQLNSLYIDNSLIASNTGTVSGTVGTAYPIGIAAYSDGSFPFQGYLDEIKIYPYARSVAQIKQDYASSISGQSTSKGSVASFGSSSSGKSLSDGLVGHWKMDDASTVLTDVSGNGNTGTVSGSSNFASGKFGTAFRGGIGTTNYITNPSFETNTTGWTDQTGGTMSRQTQPYVGTYSVGTSGGSNNRIYTTVSLTVGTTYTFSAWVKSSSTSPTAIYLRGERGDTWASLFTQVYYSSYGNWQRLTTTFVAPATVTGYFFFNNTSAVYAYMDAVQFEPTTSATPYVDGSLDSGSTWTGTAHASTSVRATSLASVPNSTSLNIATTAISYNAWVNPKLYPDTYGVIFQKSGYYDGYRLMLRSNGGLFISIGETGGGWMNSTGTLPPNTWSHVTLTYDGSAIRTYINGQLDSTKAYSNPLVASTSGISFGATEYPPLTGYTDEVRIYNRALTASEVEQLYTSAPGPIAHFNFDNKSSTGAQDISGNSNNATYYNSPSPTTGKYGNGLRLDTDNRYVGSTISPTTSSSQYTLESWINFSTVSGIQRILYPQGSSLNQIGINNGQIFVHVNSTSGSDTNVGNTNYPTNCQTGWHHLTLTVDSNLAANNVKVFCDGLNFMNGTLTNAKNGLFSFNGLYIGYNTSSQSISGSIDEVKFYNYARSPAQITEDMGTGPGSKKPIAYYKFDEGYGTSTFNSGSVGSTLNGTFGTGSSAPSWDNGGKFEKTLSFDGNNDYVTFNNRISMADDFSISSWIKASSKTTQVIVGTNQNTGGLRLSNTHITFSPNGTYVATWTGARPSNDTWHHLAVSVNRTSNLATLYVDGQSKGTQSVTGFDWTTTNEKFAFIGRDYCSSDCWFNGSIDEVKIYNYALNINDVKQDYNRGATTIIGQSTASSGSTAPGGSSTQEYCVPGSTDACFPPVIEWKLDETIGSTANDTSGHNVTGSLGTGSSAPLWTTGKVGSALNFSTPGQVVTATTSDLPNNAFTQSAWIYPTSYTGTGNNNDRNTIIYANDKYLQLQNDQKIGIYLTGLTSPGYHASNSTVPLNQWTHVAYSWNGSNIVIYINGIVDNTIPNTGNASLVMSDFRIGYQSAAYERQFDGKIDQVLVYDYARSTAQIALDYNRGKPIAYYKLDECEGTTVHSTNDSYLTTLNGTINIGLGGSQASAGTCSTSSTAWGVGATGKTNSSLSFDGLDDWVDLGKPALLNFSGRPNMTFSAWLKPSSNCPSNHGIFSNGQGGGTTTVRYDLVFYSPNRLRLVIGDGTTYSNYYSSNNSIPYNTWTHIVITLDSNNQVIFYINGKQDGSIQTLTNDLSSSSSNWKIGTSYNLTSSYAFGGQIDEVKIYNFTLTPAQIKTDYNNGAVSFR